MVVFEEVPDKITLAINITNCANNCEGCHSPELRQDIGHELNELELESLISQNEGINCVCFMGEGKDKDGLLSLARYVKKQHPELSIALYSGRAEEAFEEDKKKFGKIFDFIKIGPYDKEKGPLNKETTNQRLYSIIGGKKWVDITEKFWIKKI
jgi:anaerobic ribonucleoside-triphosphate reductase activating protein